MYICVLCVCVCVCVFELASITTDEQSFLVEVSDAYVCTYASCVCERDREVVWVFVCVFVCVGVFVCVFVLCVCVFVCVFVCVCMCVCMCVCLYVCLYVWVGICMCVCVCVLMCEFELAGKSRDPGRSLSCIYMYKVVCVCVCVYARACKHMLWRQIRHSHVVYVFRAKACTSHPSSTNLTPFYVFTSHMSVNTYNNIIQYTHTHCRRS
jgi:hypothetical protein